MKIFNLMFGKDLGGLEKASFDYALALQSRGHDVITYLNPKSKMIPVYENAQLKVKTDIKNRLGGYDILAKKKLHQEIKQHRPDLCITHGRRAALFAQKNKICPTLAVTHSFKLSPLKNVDGLIAINNSMKERALQEGFTEDQIQVVFNMLSDAEIVPRKQASHSPPLIGAMGRLVPRKGMLLFLEALKILKEKNVSFQAWVAGTGEQEEELKETIKQNALESHVQMKGWMSAGDFYEAIDVFCIPSSSEPFGLVVLEAWRYGVPICATASSGPEELIQHKTNGLLSPVEDANALAENMALLIKGQALQETLRMNGYQTVEKNYLLPTGAKRLEDALKYFLKNTTTQRAFP